MFQILRAMPRTHRTYRARCSGKLTLEGLCTHRIVVLLGHFAAQSAESLQQSNLPCFLKTLFAVNYTDLQPSSFYCDVPAVTFEMHVLSQVSATKGDYTTVLRAI